MIEECWSPIQNPVLIDGSQEGIETYIIRRLALYFVEAPISILQEITTPAPYKTKYKKHWAGTKETKEFHLPSNEIPVLIGRQKK